MTMTADQLDTMQRAVALRMSINDHAELSWLDWCERLKKRLRGVEMYTAFGERPSFESVLYVAADAMTVLCLLDEAILADPSTGEPEDLAA